MMPWSRSSWRNLVGAREVFGFLGGVALLDQALTAASDNCRLRGGLEDVENGVEPRQKGQRGSHIAGAEFAGNPWRCWRRARIRKTAASASAYSGSSLRLSTNARSAAAVRAGQLLVPPVAELVGLQTQLEIAQPVDGGSRRFQPVEREVERLRYGTEASR